MKPTEFSAFMLAPFELELEPLEEQFGNPAPGEVLELYGDYQDRFACLRAPKPAIWSTEQTIPEQYADKSTLFFVGNAPPSSSGAFLRPLVFRKCLDIGNKAFALDDRAMEDIKTRVPLLSRSSEKELCAWMKEEFFLDAYGMDGRMSAFVAVYSEEQSAGDTAGFTLVGREYLVRIARRDETLLVDSILRRRGQTFLAYDQWNGCFSFTLNTIDAKLDDPRLQQQMESRRRDPESFLNLWDRYRKLDADRINRQSENAGELVYSELSPPQEGSPLRVFSLKNSSEEVEQFVQVLRELSRDEQEVEVDDGLGSQLFDNEAVSRNSRLHFVSADPAHTEITLEVRSASSRPLPKQGVLRLAMHGWHVQNERRRKAFDKINAERCPIRRLYYHLYEIKTPLEERRKATHFTDSELIDAFGGRRPNAAQKEAVEVCFNSPDLALIQGPPGTGKTQVISAVQRLIALQRKRQERPETILLTSYQHDAVDNMADRASVFGLPAYRFGSKKVDNWEHGFTSWRDEMLSVLEGNIEGEERSEKLLQLRQVKKYILYLRSAKLPDSALVDGLAQLLNAYEALAPGLLDDAIQDRLTEEYRMLKRILVAASGRMEYFRRAVWGLRTAPQSYSDDGVAQVRRLTDILYSSENRNIFCDVASDDTLDWLEQLGAEHSIPSNKDFERLEKLQGDLLAALTLTQSRKQACIEDLKACLGDALKSINSRLEVCQVGRADILEEFLDRLRSDPEIVRQSIARYTLAYATTCQQSGKEEFFDVRNLHLSGNNAEFDFVVVDEAARANPLDLFIPMVLGRRKIILVGDHRQLPQLLEPEIEAELSKQDVDSVLLKESLFERLWKYLASKPDGEPRTVTLNIQYRMHPELGDFVSKTFYEGEGVTIKTTRSAEEFIHQVAAYQGRFAAWEDCAGEQEQRYKGGRGWHRPSEAQKIVDIAVDVLKNSPESVGIITMYRGQQESILELLEHKGVASSGTVVSEYADRLRVGTVDSFQGREFDVVLLSPVRSNKQKAVSIESARRKFGFLTFENRMNVALSRQRKLLIVVGDRKMFQSDSAREYVAGLHAFEKLCGESTCN
jgi:hypothetical protein